MAKCKICGSRLAVGVTNCPACGAVVGEEPKAQNINVVDSPIEQKNELKDNNIQKINNPTFQQPANLQMKNLDDDDDEEDDDEDEKENECSNKSAVRLYSDFCDGISELIWGIIVFIIKVIVIAASVFFLGSIIRSLVCNEKIGDSMDWVLNFLKMALIEILDKYRSKIICQN